MDVVNEIEILETEVRDCNEKCQRVHCNAIYDAIMSLFQLMCCRRGRIQVEVGEARPRKKPSSESVHVAGPQGPADPVDPSMGLHFVHKYRNVTYLCFDLKFSAPIIPFT